MIYPYHCAACNKEFDVIKSMHDAHVDEVCPKCGTIGNRIYTSFQVIGAKVESPEFNQGLGCVIKNKKHREEVAKSQGLVEVGNESPVKTAKKIETEKKERWEREWSKL